MSKQTVDVDAHTEVTVDIPDSADIKAYRRELDEIHGEFSEVLNRLHDVEEHGEVVSSQILTLKDAAQRSLRLMAEMNERLLWLNEKVVKDDAAYDKSVTRRLNSVVDMVGERLNGHDKRLASIDANQGRHERRIYKLIEYLRTVFGANLLRGED
jgi:archaellum component FlaC